MTAESSPWDRLAAWQDAHERRPRERFAPPKLTVRAASPGEVAVWRQWAHDGRLPQVALEILGALLAKRGEDA